MLEIYLFVIVFSFYCWLFCPVDADKRIQGWDVIEPDTSWIGWSCELSYSIRQLKKLAKERHIHGYGNMTKSQLIEALAA